MDLSDIDTLPPESAPHHGKRRDDRPASAWDPPTRPRGTDEHEESHLVRGYD